MKMLLNDFEDQGSDWLFEVDRDRRIMGASKHFSDETGLAPENLNGRLFENLFQVGPECAQLVDHLVNRRAFRRPGTPARAGRWEGAPLVVGQRPPRNRRNARRSLLSWRHQ